MKKSILILFLFPLFLFAQENANKEIYEVVEEMPRFPGCEDIADLTTRKKCATNKMVKFVYKNIIYPEAAKKNRTEGIVAIRFIIAKDGSIKNAEIKKDIGDGCGQEALRVISSMNDMPEKWIAGKQNGKAVNVYFNATLKFNLDKSAVFTLDEVDERPRFPGCELVKEKKEKNFCVQKKMLEFLYRNIKYPANARDQRIEGTVIISFVVTKDGEITNAEITKDIGGDCGKEALKVVQMMQEKKKIWIPAKKDGKAVDCYFEWPAKFRLEG